MKFIVLTGVNGRLVSLRANYITFIEQEEEGTRVDFTSNNQSYEILVSNSLYEVLREINND